ncbi:DegT/DnrJ/EryC1/StrS family aminotransferase [Streptomyces sp. I05A-00742]|uniref:DegT/DnrJ/EryC1/StrS family aminotransferase n=1 Tax=Streptomyces sp. I05A-00742 TaxID=2732853 RepID=UPI00148961E4|nr:DegT/DnrJ/EryC1/StrS family aminotransferase [Streptomyces sp. I05A-00742]
MGTEELLTAAGVGFGDEVVVPSYATTGAAAAVRAVGATPVFADIDATSYCLAPAAVAEAITDRTAAIVPTDLFGYPADLIALQALAGGRPMPVIPHVERQVPGDTADALRRRRAHASYLDGRLTGVLTPRTAPGVDHRYHSYVVRVPGNGRPDRDAFARALRSRGVRCSVPVQTPVHRMPGFMREVWLPETERAAQECLALPVDADMSRRELHKVVAACNALGGLLPYGAAA